MGQDLYVRDVTAFCFALLTQNHKIRIKKQHITVCNTHKKNVIRKQFLDGNGNCIVPHKYADTTQLHSQEPTPTTSTQIIRIRISFTARQGCVMCDGGTLGERHGTEQCKLRSDSCQRSSETGENGAVAINTASLRACASAQLFR